ncbi:MAG: nuclear transport factor 2 family protein [Nocardioidaceae bacterium]
MPDARSTTRKSVEDFATAWLDGDEATVARACSPGVRWWTPVAGETGPGPAATWAALTAILEAAPRPIEITALAISDDGSRGVVEMRAAAGAPTGSATLVTSVVRVSSGKVVEGRTYADPATQTAPTAENP